MKKFLGIIMVIAALTVVEVISPITALMAAMITVILKSDQLARSVINIFFAEAKFRGENGRGLAIIDIIENGLATYSALATFAAAALEIVK